ncbi:MULTISPECIES: TraR/DksA C4-type zinc finger protein [unclassified Moraxella]|uniref:TraR/DksA C4-type zinc finger protein n=1 Tax=unclassified Moraxella TaxID=2685852 RepID=UPI003AF4D77D
MGDIVDRANEEADRWLQYQIAKTHHEATDDTECIDCGEPIGTARKKSIPWAVRCMKCQTEHEQGGKR